MPILCDADRRGPRTLAAAAPDTSCCWLTSQSSPLATLAAPIRFNARKERRKKLPGWVGTLQSALPLAGLTRPEAAALTPRDSSLLTRLLGPVLSPPGHFYDKSFRARLAIRFRVRDLRGALHANIRRRPMAAAGAVGAAHRGARRPRSAPTHTIYRTMGRYDVVAIVDAPNDVAMNTILYSVGSWGTIRTDTLGAFTRQETDQTLSKMA